MIMSFRPAITRDFNEGFTNIDFAGIKQWSEAFNALTTLPLVVIG